MAMSLTTSSERLSAVDFSYTYYIDTVTFTAPLPTATHSTDLLTPFDKYTWTSTLLIILFLNIILFIINLIHDQCHLKYNTIWSTFAIILRQKITDTILYSKYNRLCLITWILMCI